MERKTLFLVHLRRNLNLAFSSSMRSPARRRMGYHIYSPLDSIHRKKIVKNLKPSTSCDSLTPFDRLYNIKMKFVIQALLLEIL